MRALLEIAAFNYESAQIAAAAGADRIELCAGAEVGGTTPDMRDVRRAVRELSCPVFVMIRPRGGHFIYTAEEQAQMAASLLEAKAAGAQGFVFGILMPGSFVDEAANAKLIALAQPLPCTFHRAFDEIADKAAALKSLIRCGFRRVLTSGGEGKAMDFLPDLAALVRQAAGQIIVMPGGGIRGENITAVVEATCALEYHSAAVAGSSYTADTTEVCRLKAALS